MFATNDDRFIPHVTSLQTAVVVANRTPMANNIRNLRIKFFRYMWVAFAVYVGLCAHLG